MILRITAEKPAASRLSRREARFLDDLMTAAAAIAIGLSTWAVVSLVG